MFSVLNKSKKSSARLGVLKTINGEIKTPAINPHIVDKEHSKKLDTALHLATSMPS